MKQFLSYSKNYVCKFMQAIHDIINYSISIYPLASGKCRKEGKKLPKSEYLENEKSFLDGIKNFFIVFEGLSFGEKIKIWWKIAARSFNYFRKKLHLRYLTEFSTPLRSCTLFLCLHFDLNSKCQMEIYLFRADFHGN